VIASVYRHNPRDYDENGQRILCPRFGSVTCGEHIAIEPQLFGEFFDGRRIAPRHIGVELDRSETYDVYYAFDTDSVFQAIREGVADRPEPPPVDRGDRTTEELVASKDIADREEVERTYVQGDRVLRKKLVQAAARAGGDAPVDLLRLAVFDLDVELNRLAREALAEAESESAVWLIAEALRVPMEPTERGSLISALARLGETYPHARTLATVHQGLEVRSKTVDVEGWSNAFEGSKAPAPSVGRIVLEYELENKARLADARPDDARAFLEYAEATLALAVDPETAVALAADPRTRSKYASLMFEDVQGAARRAHELGETGWRTSAALAVAAYYLGELEEARAQAELAVGGMPPGESGWGAMAALAIYAQARQQLIREAKRAKKEWPAEWLTEVNAAYSVLARHPLGTAGQVVAHTDFLRSLGAVAQAGRVLREGLARFPDSPQLHDRLRGRVLFEKGVEGLEKTYEEMLTREDASPNLEWFAGYASLVAAEFYRRSGRDEEAFGAYDRGIAHYERAIASNPESRDSSDHYVALALAGRARLDLEHKNYEVAVEEILASFARRPDAAASLDGLGFSPVGTAQMLLAALEEIERPEMAARIQAGLDALDPELLRLPAFEGEGPSGPSGARRRAWMNRRSSRDQ
jgi:tetratricopeptide (TPR) repeat protein